MSEGGAEEKTEQASNRKLRKQREQGSLPRSVDIVSMLNIVVSLVILASTFSMLYLGFSNLLSEVMETIRLDFESSAFLAVSATVSSIFSIGAMIVGTTIAIMILFVTLYQGGLPFSFTPLTPDINRINPASGFQRIFQTRNIVETCIQLVRITIWLSICALIVYFALSNLFRIDLCGKNCALALVSDLLFKIFIAAVLMMLVFGIAEIIIQRALYQKEQKMAKSEVKRENKEQYGSPEIRRERSRLRKELASESESSGVSRANMAFYYADMTVGIRFHPSVAPLPRVAVKAKGPNAGTLREDIEAAGYPIMAHERITKSCFKCAQGAPVRREVFEDLANAIAKMFPQGNG